MTPQDIILSELRDIHLPGPAADRLDLAWEPFVILAALVATAVLGRRRRRSQWRRDAQQELRASRRVRPAAAQWPLLLDLLRRSAPFVGAHPPPECVFLPPDRIGDAEVQELQAHLHRIIGR